MEKGFMLMSNCRFIAAFLRKYCSVAVGSSMVWVLSASPLF